jgi:capsular exopolysaccharide synthesis family protein
MRYSADSAMPPETEEYVPAASTGPNINLRHYWYVLLERRWLVICAYLTVLALTGVYLYAAPRIFRASTRLQIDPESESSVNLREMVFRTGADADYLQTQYKNLLSRQLLGRVLQKERLSDDPRYAKNPDLARALADDIGVTPVRMTRLVDVSVEHTSPKKASDIANTLVTEFIDWNTAQRQARNSDMLFFLKNQVSGLEGEVTRAEQDLHDYRMRTKFVSLEKGDNIIAEALNQAQSRAAEAKSRAQTSQTVVDELDKHVTEGKSLEAFPPISTDGQIKSLQGQLVSQENELAGLLKKYKDKYPAVIQARSRIAETKRAIDQAAQQLVNVLRSDARLAWATQTNLQGIVSEWEERQGNWNQAKMEYDVLARKAETKKALYNAVLSKMSEIDVTQKEKVNNIRVVDPATPPAVPVKPNVPITVALGAVGGLVIALGLALFVNFMDDSIKSQDDVETYLRLPFLGYIPNIKSNSLVERYQHSHLSPQSNAAESFRTVRAAITLGSRGERFRILTVTSNVPSEGKSTIAANLAIVIAQTGLRTLLVDTDLRRPSVHQGFGLRGVTGLAAYLAGKVNSIEEIARSTEIPNLEIVCCGSTPSQPSELLSSRRMADFIQEASRRYERIILDCPPVSAVSDPLIVSTLADAVILVTKFNKVRREMARKSVQRILESGLQICGAVINDIDFDGRDAYYYSYYYYQNRYYKGYYHAKPAPEPAAEAPAAAEGESKKLVS